MTDGKQVNPRLHPDCIPMITGAGQRLQVAHSPKAWPLAPQCQCLGG